MKNNITLEEWACNQLKTINSFVDDWKKLNDNDKESFPMTMYYGDWDEQMEIWYDSSEQMAKRALAKLTEEEKKAIFTN